MKAKSCGNLKIEKTTKWTLNRNLGYNAPLSAGYYRLVPTRVATQYTHVYTNLFVNNDTPKM